jgi:hypothetical protein
MTYPDEYQLAMFIFTHLVIHGVESHRFLFSSTNPSLPSRTSRPTFTAIFRATPLQTLHHTRAFFSNVFNFAHSISSLHGCHTLVAMPSRTLADAAKVPLKSALKRSASDIEDVEDSQPQRKRCRTVQFNEADNKTELFWNEKSAQLVKEEVRRAIEGHLARDSSNYAALKSILTTKSTASDAPSPILLKRYIDAISVSSQLVNKECRGLVAAVLDCSWLGRSDEFLVSYRRLLANIISAHGGFAPLILESIVDKFVECMYITSQARN